MPLSKTAKTFLFAGALVSPLVLGGCPKSKGPTPSEGQSTPAAEVKKDISPVVGEASARVAAAIGEPPKPQGSEAKPAEGADGPGIDTIKEVQDLVGGFLKDPCNTRYRVQDLTALQIADRDLCDQEGADNGVEFSRDKVQFGRWCPGEGMEGAGVFEPSERKVDLVGGLRAMVSQFRGKVDLVARGIKRRVPNSSRHEHDFSELCKGMNYGPDDESQMWITRPEALKKRYGDQATRK